MGKAGSAIVETSEDEDRKRDYSETSLRGSRAFVTIFGIIVRVFAWLL